MASLVVPITSIERLTPLVSATATVARSMPAPVDIVLGPELSKDVDTIQPIIDQATGDLTVKIHLGTTGYPWLPSEAGPGRPGHTVLVVDQGCSSARENDGLHTRHWTGQVLLVPNDFEASLPSTLGLILIALVDADRESIRVTMPATTRIALHCGAHVAIGIVLPEQDSTSPLDASKRDDEQRLQLLATMNIQRYLDKLATNLRARGVRVSWETRIGSPVDEFVRLVETTSPDLVIMSLATRPIAEQISARTGTLVMLV